MKDWRRHIKKPSQKIHRADSIRQTSENEKGNKYKATSSLLETEEYKDNSFIEHLPCACLGAKQSLQVIQKFFFLPSQQFHNTKKIFTLQFIYKETLIQDSIFFLCYFQFFLFLKL